MFSRCSWTRGKRSRRNSEKKISKYKRPLTYVFVFIFTIVNENITALERHSDYPSTGSSFSLLALKKSKSPRVRGTEKCWKSEWDKKIVDWIIPLFFLSPQPYWRLKSTLKALFREQKYVKTAHTTFKRNEIIACNANQREKYNKSREKWFYQIFIFNMFNINTYKSITFSFKLYISITHE